MNSEATTNIAAIENKTVLSIEEFFFIGEPPFLVNNSKCRQVGTVLACLCWRQE